jgi:colanic acid biosynthesis glycosyl transferase WcaI
MHIVVHDYAGHSFQIDLSRELARRGHRVTHAFAGQLLTPRGSLTRRTDDPPGLEFREISMNPNYRRYKYSFLRRRNHEAQYGKELVKTLGSLRPDVILSGNTPSEPQRELQRYCASQEIRFVNWIQDIYSVAVDKLARKKLPLIGHFVGWYYRAVDQRCSRDSDHIVVISEDFSPILESWGVQSQNITAIHNWAAIDSLPRLGADNDWAASHGLLDKFVFLYSGTLAMKHNPDLLLQLALTFRYQSDVAIVVVSEGPGAEWLTEQKSTHQLDNLMLFPFQPFDRFPEVMASANVLIAVLESDAGVFSVPSKVLSYLCAGRPLVAAMPENNLAAKMIRSIPAGYVSPPKDVTGFIDHAVQLHAQPQSRDELGDNARKFAESQFDIQGIADRFEKIFETKP